MLWRYFFFFFSSRRRHTRLQGDWSSDVCSSDLDCLVHGIILWVGLKVGSAGPASLQEHGRDDDRARQHEPARLADRVYAEDLLERADRERAEQRKADAPAPAHEVVAADDGDRDRRQLVG